MKKQADAPNEAHPATACSDLGSSPEQPGPAADAGEGAPAPGAAAGVAEEAAADAAALAGEVRRLQQELVEAREEAESLKNRWIRLQADFDNFRRRTQREREEFALYANEDFIKQVLPLLDNLERAVKSPEGGGLKEGVELILKQFVTVLEKSGLTPIAAVGQPFDPFVHEAIMQVEDSEHEDPTVVEEFQKGYRMGDRVIRPSMVKVARK